MKELMQTLEDDIAGLSPHLVAAALEVVFRGRATLEKEDGKRRLWKRMATALGRVRVTKVEEGKGTTV